DLLCEEAVKTLRQETPRCVVIPRGGEGVREGLVARGEAAARVFLDPVFPPPTLFVFGAGHVGRCTAQAAALAGMRVVVVDDRADFANRERFPWADAVIVAPFEQVFEQLALDESSYVVSVTRGHEYDETVVEHTLRTSARYIGMIGSRRKVRFVFDRLRQKGISDHALARVHAPIGLAIGADTPEEIAISIVAEVIAVRRGVSACHSPRTPAVGAS
ncbi:MAG: XdhC family protein, partial [Armatimonadota bacterium]|nr:XdhC family protein [Armatimonadota bacterium]